MTFIVAFYSDATPLICLFFIYVISLFFFRACTYDMLLRNEVHASLSASSLLAPKRNAPKNFTPKERDVLCCTKKI